MDIVHHALIGGAGMIAAASADQELIGLAFLGGSVLPDLDALSIVVGKRFFLKNHQGITHSIFMAPLLAYILICWPISFLPVELALFPIFLAALAGCLIHIVFDWLNTYRIQLFAPFSKRRFSMDAVFFIDTFTILLTCLFYVLHFFLKIDGGYWWYPVSFLLYFLLKAKLQKFVKRKLQCQYVIPCALNPFGFLVLDEGDEEAVCFRYNALVGKKTDFVRYPIVSEVVLKMARKSQVFIDMEAVCRALRITKIDATEVGIAIHAKDLAVRNFGGKFGMTRIRFDKEGRLIDEMANI